MWPHVKTLVCKTELGIMTMKNRDQVAIDEYKNMYVIIVSKCSDVFMRLIADDDYAAAMLVLQKLIGIFFLCRIVINGRAAKNSSFSFVDAPAAI